MDSLPPRYKPHNVERFAPIIKEMCADYIKHGVSSHQFDPRPLGMNPDTAVARFGDAMTAYIKGIVTDPDISPTLLQKIRPFYRVTHDWVDNRVHIKPKQAQNIVVPDFVNPTIRVGQMLFSEILTGFATQLATGVLRGSVTILGFLDPTLKLRLESDYGAVFTHISPAETRMTSSGLPSSSADDREITYHIVE